MYNCKCKLCLFVDICNGRDVCDGFYPADEDQSDIGFIIEEGRKEYYREWFEYISGDDISFSSYQHDFSIC